MIRNLVIYTIALGLSACTVGPDYEQQGNTFSGDWVSPKSKHTSEENITREWWGIFNDPLLERYLEQSVEHNKDIDIALANLRKARALSQEERSVLLPQIGSSAQATRSKSSEALNNNRVTGARSLYDATLDASWEIDIFGGTRRAVEAADARTQSIQADYQGVLLATLSEVARNYFEARGLQKRIKITRDNANYQQQTFKLVKARFDVGEASGFDLSRARGEYQLTYARVPNLEAELHAFIYALSVMLGNPPEALLDEMMQLQPLPTPPDVVPVGLRSELLRRRPDVRSAERRLAASVADIGAEKATLFPKFFLTGDSGSQAQKFGDLFSSAAEAWSLGSIVRWPLFEGGAIRARIKAQTAESEAALAFYEKTILTTLSDAETALIRYGRELETRKRLDEAVQSRRVSVLLATELFDAGETDYLAVLDSERELIASEDSLVVSETLSITKLITLYTVLGGGWDVYDNSSSEK